jgi:soluble lytic murein transglycosylase-like protein
MSDGLRRLNRLQAKQRRTLLVALSASPWLALHPSIALAGRQLEEPLADSVRSALSAAIASHAPPVPEHVDASVNAKYLRWLEHTGVRLRSKVPNDLERTELLQTIWYESRRAGLEVSTVLGLIQVESNFRKYAISRVGARGLMQVMPFWTRVIGDGDPSRLFHLQTNLRFGCVILRHYLDIEKGNYYYALGRYNGSRGQPQYPAAVLAAKLRWVL